MCTSIDDVIFYNAKTIVDDKGNLTPIEQSKDVPFDIKRVFYVYGVRGEAIRGRHAHYDTKQILICLKGKIDVICNDGKNEVRYLLESPQQAVLIPELIWDEQIYRSEDSILLSICSSYYEKKDYITDFEEFKRIKGVN
tara:strand:+ start:413 stop:829 length:417 start_codon:yes stop_codon:yes gene_type:complete